MKIHKLLPELAFQKSEVDFQIEWNGVKDGPGGGMHTDNRDQVHDYLKSLAEKPACLRIIVDAGGKKGPIVTTLSRRKGDQAFEVESIDSNTEETATEE